jgi:very-short-patch-repair endonuclease
LLGQGNSKFEQQVDAIAKSMGVFFSAYQYWVPLTIMTETTIDFVIFGKKDIAIYADGPEHTLRPDVAETDAVRRMELEAKGWTVIAIAYDDFLTDPEGQVARILYA